MTAPAVSAPRTEFELPPGLEARRPPERRGLRRDGVRLLVARQDGLRHRRFGDLAEELTPGDLLAVNASATLPAAVDAARADGRPVVVHAAAELDGGGWVVELRRPDASGPEPGAAAGERLDLPDGVRLALLTSHPQAGLASWGIASKLYC